MANIAYNVLFILSVFNILLLSVVVKRQKCFYYVIFFMLISISCFGNVVMANATEMSVALLGKILTYFGACFLPYCFLLCVSEFCQSPVNRWLSLLMFLYNMGVFALVWLTQQGIMLYYSGMEIVQRDGITVVVTQPGPLRFLYDVLVVFYAVAVVAVLVRALCSKKNISYKNLWMLISLQLFTTVIYVFEKAVNQAVDWVFFTYIIDEFVFLALIYQIGKYDVSDCIAGSIKGLEDYAYIIFDLKLNYLGGSPMLKEYFPDIIHVKVDKPIESCGSKSLESCMAWLKDSVMTGEKEPLYITHLERDLKCTWRTINNGLFGGNSGYLVEVFDDTVQQRYLRLMAKYNAELEDEVEAKREHIQKMQDKIIIGISDIVESRDNNTGGHVKRTSEAVRIFMAELAKESAGFHLTEKYVEDVIKAAPMHDLGKVAVEDYILKKPGRFTDEEFRLMQVHAAVGAEIVEKVLNGVEDDTFMEVAKNIAHYHHEKWNGKGYPEGLAGDSIPLEARIMALADVFDALVSKRCYKEEYSYEEAFRIVEESLGSHFDPKLGKIFLKCRNELEAYYDMTRD